jgi:hypothetical protein
LLVEVAAVLLLQQVVQAIMWFFLSFCRYSFLRYLKSLGLYDSCTIMTLFCKCGCCWECRALGWRWFINPYLLKS